MPSSAEPPAGAAGSPGGRLRLLAEVSYDDRPVAGDRSHALLAALVRAGGAAVGERALAAAVWGPDDQPATPAKALQVVVSRTRSQTAADLVVRVDRGYRLSPGASSDHAELQAHAAAARTHEAAREAAAARESARAALAVPVAGAGSETAAVEELRAEARALQRTARLVLARTSSALGEHREALHLLEPLVALDPEGCGELDEATLAALLRSEAAERGAPAALARYEHHREQLADRLGVDPGPQLQQLHAELLLADRPVRHGLRFDATSLVGRDDDVRALRAMVRESRVTSIVGPGGLGKTRLAHLLAREAEAPVVCFVELVGVTAPDDVVDEVGSALGVRDSVSGRRVLTAEQRGDVRGRIAQQLDLAPSLLVLDNCEHVVDAVADLVAFLVATTRGLRVLTTSRAPLAIAAERVFTLDQLSVDDAAVLFEQRARAARPDVPLPAETVRRVCARLDGLPLAIELAAARVRAMSVEEVDRRLDDRFALLRGADRTAPDRHQTLLAVIAWSWNLLDGPEQRALARLSLFRDGFTLEAAEAVLGDGAFAAVENLVGQSLLTVRESHGAVRYRMLETVREFGRRQLAESGDAVAADAARRDWGRATATRGRAGLDGVDQVATVRWLAPEENNLTDVLHDALAEPDPHLAVTLMAALGLLWTIQGEHRRVVALTSAIDEALRGWEPDAASEPAAVQAATAVALNAAISELPSPQTCQALLDRYAQRSPDPQVRALSAITAAMRLDDPDRARAALDDLVASPDRAVTMFAHQWRCHLLENEGDPEAAVQAGRLSLDLWRPEDGVWQRGMLHAQLAGLHAQLGRIDLAVTQAEQGLVLLQQLGARDDAVQLQAVLATGAIAAGDLDAASRIVAEMVRDHDPSQFGGAVTLSTTRADLAVARGEVAEALALFDAALAAVRTIRMPGPREPGGLEPWTLYVESLTLAAFAVLTDDPARHGTDLHTALTDKAPALLDAQRRRFDVPVAGSVLFALGLWRLARVPQERESGLDLLALARGLGYHRYHLAMAWEPAVELAEGLAPGALARRVDALGERRGPALLDDARAAVTPGSGSPGQRRRE